MMKRLGTLAPMRYLIGIFLFCGCAASAESIKPISLQQLTSQTYTLQIQPRLKICEGRFGPMASWAFAQEMRSICSKAGNEIFLKLVNSPPSVPIFKPQMLCGGTLGPVDEQEAQLQRRFCKGRTGWITSGS